MASIANSSYNGDTLYVKQLSVINPTLLPINHDYYENSPQLSDIIVLHQIFKATGLNESHIFDSLDIDHEFPYIVITQLPTLKAGLHKRKPLKSLSLSYFCDSKPACDLWDIAIQTLTEFFESKHYPDNSIRSDLLLNLGTPIPHSGVLSPHSVQSVAIFILAIAYSLVIAYIALSIFKLRLVRSKFSIFMTFLFQTLASICSAYTILNLLVPPFVFHQFRYFFATSFIVLLVTAEDTFRLINNVSRISDESLPTQKLLTAFLTTAPNATKRVLTNSLLLLTLSLPVNILGIAKPSFQFRALCLFGAVSLMVSFILHVTFFTSILLVDIRRTELEDLIWTTDSFNGNGALDDSTVFNTVSLSTPKPNKLRLHQRLFMLLDPLFKLKIPFTQTKITSTIIILFYVITLKGLIFYSGYEETLLTLYLNSIFSSVPASSSALSCYSLKIRCLLSFPLSLSSLSKKVISPELLKSTTLTPFSLLLTSPYSHLLISKPIIMGIHQNSLRFRIIDNTLVNYLLNIVNSISIYSLLEFTASIVFILSLTIIILKLILPPEVDEPEPTNIRNLDHFFSSKDLLGFHQLDVLSIYSQDSYIVSLSMDHKLCLWNLTFSRGRSGVLPQGHQPMEIPITDMIWPINHVVLSAPNFCLAAFSTKSSTVLGWDFKTSSVVFRITDPHILSTKPICTFFSGNFLVFVSKNNTLVTISNTSKSCEPKVMKVPFRDTNSHIIAAERILTHPMPERLVFVSSENEVVVATHVGKKWIMKSLKLYESTISSPAQILSFESNYFNQHDNNGSSSEKLEILMPPSRLHIFNSSRPCLTDTIQLRPMAKYSGIRLQSGHDMKGILQVPKIPGGITGKLSCLISVPRLNMIFLASPLHGVLIDIQTGVISKHFQLGNFSPKSLRVFHSEPTHCRFCGVTSIESFSVAYTDLDDLRTVMCHTYTIDNRSKNNICLRVERDPREIRCLGFEATTERQHWINRVEGWETTGINMIMGVRRKEFTQPSISKKSEIPKFEQEKDCTIIHDEDEETGSEDDSYYNNSSSQYLRHRGRNQNRDKLDQSHRFISSFKPVLSSSRKRFWFAYQVQKKPPLAVTWEGWVMSANGKVSYYDIPESYSDDLRNNDLNPYRSNENNFLDEYAKYDQQARLLIGTIGPVARYGNKSIAVVFGNIIKVLYFGNEEPVTADNSMLDNGLERGARRPRSRNNSAHSSIESFSSRISVSSRSSFTDNANNIAEGWRRAPGNS
ncbi:hypothetical protein NADFUDRAFT_83463 [Nadsonia fulvescens var. elongata DSM 6958]|uniref:Sterol regulatory element-binding protein cleavage-activating protein n=1 Tax=Nadsonia fulvescens var. elongata DSM 6958 TaxID=857566 RepID=A0A1E3PGD5_9ASCO|nr:hypothetical protein NADFUDRAFT_83463 [Nadsonia fulvescens var. elongata DSM 6958]